MDVGLLEKFRLVCRVSEKYSGYVWLRVITVQLMRLRSGSLAADLQSKHSSSSGSNTAQLFVVFLCKNLPQDSKNGSTVSCLHC